MRKDARPVVWEDGARKGPSYPIHLLMFIRKFTVRIENTSKLQSTLQAWPTGAVATSAWFSSRGISPQLLKKYSTSHWVTPLASGAYIKTGDQVNWQGGLYAMQAQTKVNVHAGALTALSLQGYAHFVRLGRETLFLFSPPKSALPLWFKSHDWGHRVIHSQTSVLPTSLALTEFKTALFPLKVSAPERAILECLHLSPDAVNLTECYQMMEGLTTLRPKLLQPLLQQCRSIKVKRLFLYMADKAGHEWSKRLDLARVDLGTGARSIASGGVYIAKFGITIPEDLAKL